MPDEVPAHQPSIDYGRRLIPRLVDDIAISTPERPFISIPRSTKLEDGYNDITYAAFAKAVNCCCWWIDHELRTRDSCEKLLYIGPSDLRYLIILLAAAKTGHIAFFSSPRNSLEAHLSLLESSQCHTILIPDHPPTIVKQILAARSMQELSLPALDYFMTKSDNVEFYPFRGTFAELRYKTFVVLHTSGSTGLPKPVNVTYGTFACNDAHQLIPSLGGNVTSVHHLKRKRVLVALPLFHAAGLGMAVGFGVFAEMISILPPPRPLTADLINNIHTYADIHGSVLPPSIIVDIWNNAQYLSIILHNIQFLAYAGGSLAKEIGDSLSTKIKLLTLMGSTENMYLPIELYDDPDDWQYITISPFLGCEFRPSQDPELQELHIIRNKNLDLFQGIFSTFPDIDEYSTCDLYKQHPRRPEAWVFQGRADDIIVFSNGEKLNPVSIEATVSAHPKVHSAIITGQGRFQASLLVEPKDQFYPSTTAEKEELLVELLPSINRANQDCPAYGRILKDFVIFTTLDKPMPRAGKGTVQRYATLRLYADELKALYDYSMLKDQFSGTLAKIKSGLPQTISRPSVCTCVFNGSTEDGENLGVLSTKVGKDDDKPEGKGPGVSGCKLKDGLYDGSSLRENESSNAILESLRAMLYQAIYDTVHLHDLTDEVDLFDCGLDSLHVLALTEKINDFLPAMRPHIGSIQPAVVYDNSTVGRLLKLFT